MKPIVFIVDDSLTVRMDLQEAFGAAGFATMLWATAAEARVALSQYAPALVIIDVLLPDANGVDLLDEIKSAAATAKTPVMLLSSEADVRDRVRGLKRGADEYVGKPYDQSYIVSRARELIRHAEPKITSGSASVLIIDDSMTFREELRSILESAGYIVATAATGEDGLRIAVDIRPAAIIVDGNLPGIDGGTVIRRVRADTLLRRTPCLLLTAATDKGGELNALDAGADAYLRKQDDADVILARLSAVLRSSAASSMDASASSLLSPKKILAVDDSLTYLQAVAGELRHEGYEVVLAHSGEEALELLAVQSVDCILLDLVMPGLSGQETCRRIKSSPAWRDIPLIMHTALAEHDAMIEGINAGADDYVAKSSEFEVLRARLRAQLRRKQFEDENRLIREHLLRSELEAAKARAAHELAETRAVLLTELEKKNVNIEETNKELIRATRAKSDFLSMMSHELRTPLNSIIGFSELLIARKFGELNERQGRYVENVHNSGRHLLHLINELLDLSKIEAGRIDLVQQTCSIIKIASEAITTLQPLADAKQLIVTLEAPHGSAPAVSADAIRLKQVFYNLLSNAIKFTPTAGMIRIEIALLAEPKNVRVGVVDSGPGISAAAQERLFQPFSQLENARGQAMGTGLGLALTKRLVELMGGTVGVESTPGHGATFFFELPLQRELRAPTLLPEPSASERATDPLALIVDDDPAAQELIALPLRSAGYRILTASSGEQGIDLARKYRPDLISLDVFLPNIDGWDVLRVLGNDQLTSAIPVIMTTISSNREKAFSLGAIEHLVKPFDSAALVEALARHSFTTKVTKGKVHVLAIDDDLHQLELIRVALEPRGFSVQVATTGRAGIETALAGPTDLLLLDLVLPDISGIEVVEALRQHSKTKNLPILLITANELTREDRARLNGDVTAVLSKNAMSTDDLLGEIRRIIKK